MGPCLDTGNPDVEKTSLPPEDGHPGLDFTSPRHIRLFDRPKDFLAATVVLLPLLTSDTEFQRIQT